MSEPVSSMDVEDVLSSIRRLVSEEAKGGTDPKEGAETDSFSAIDENIHVAAENAARDALQDVARQVLGDDAFDEVEPPSNDFEGDDAPVQIAQKLVLTEALRVSDKQEDAAETLSSSLRDLVDAESLDAEARDDAQEEVFEPALNANANVRPLRPSQFEASPEDSLFERAKQAMDQTHSQSTRPERRVHFSRTEPDMMDDGSSLSEDRAEIETPTAEIPSEVKTTASFDAVEPETAEKPEAVVEEAPEPDHSPFAEAEQGFADQVADVIEDAEVVEEIAPESDDAEDTAAEASTINFAEEDSILDEETLRDLVSELVRSELQGELGDRITRNVRKLVRREIQRALSTREFE